MIPRLCSFGIGIWLMAAPEVLEYYNPARVNDRICGPLIASFAIIAIWEITREVRWINTAVGYWLISAPLVLHYTNWISIINSLICAFVLLFCSLVPGRRTHRFNGGWPSLFSSGGDDGG